MYAEASKAAVRISSPELASQVNTLLAVNAYEQDDLPGGAAPAAEHCWQQQLRISRHVHATQAYMQLHSTLIVFVFILLLLI